MTAVDDLAAWLTQIWDEQERVVSEPGVARLVAPTPDGTALAEFAVLNGELHADPTFVLARIAADRQILNHCLKLIQAGRATSFLEDITVVRAADARTTIALLALSHAGQPGYLEDEWRP